VNWRTPLLSDLREPPTVGKFYMVPAVHYAWHDHTKHWPVLGPLHEDSEFFGFDNHHYHIDMRFVTASECRFALRKLPFFARSGDPEIDIGTVFSGIPLANRNTPVPTGRPQLRRMRCARAYKGTRLLQSLLVAVAIEAALQERYGSPAEPIHLRDGRKLCPHRKVDLSQYTPDAEGIVTCPLHGLRVRCGAADSVGQSTTLAEEVL
jgi:hypothetical protein